MIPVKKINYRLSPLYQQLGVTSVVVAEIYGLDNTRDPNDNQLAEIEKSVQKALKIDELTLESSSVLEGYRQVIQLLGRSLKKFPPCAEALVRTVQRIGKLPDINPVVNLYNSMVLNTFISLGVHDLDKIRENIYFRFSEGGETFYPIASKSIVTQKGDYVYADDEKILAWMGVRDSELAKVSEETRNIVLIAQGHKTTTVELRQQILEETCALICRYCGGEFRILTVNAE